MEVFEFTKSESPYRKANKGWINKDIFLDLNPSVDINKQMNEAVNVTLFWSPINNLLSNIFILIILCSILVFTSISFSKGRFDFHIFSKYTIIDNVKFEEIKAQNIDLLEDINTINSINKQDLEAEDLDEANPLDSNLIKADENIIDQKIDKQDNLMREIQTNQNIKILQNMKPKSNFI
tara:strand:+ start:373 stop:909 length:537 start_codon:yes stop_codon:yes gene_type:complete